MAVVATGCLDVEEAYEAVDWKIIFLIFGMLALAMALEKTRGAELVAHTLIRGLGGWGPLVVLCIVHCAFALNSPVASGRLHARPEANI